MADDLTDKQRVFVEAYLTCWNATEAARRAGYEGNDVTLAAVGYENLRKPQIAELVTARLTDKAMAADEVLARLADQARGAVDDFFDIGPKGGAKLNLAKAAKAGKLHLVHRYTKGDKGKIGIEWYDAQTALSLIGKHLGLFIDKAEITGKDGGPIQTQGTVVVIPDNGRGDRDSAPTRAADQLPGDSS